MFPGSKGALLSLVIISMFCLLYFNGEQKEALLDIKRYSMELENYSEDLEMENLLAIRGLEN